LKILAPVDSNIGSATWLTPVLVQFVCNETVILVGNETVIPVVN